MPEIKPDLSDKTRCVSVHWTLPVQCVLPPTHREDHEAWHPHTGNRMRYCRTMGAWRTEELHHGEWHDLKIPPPGGYCGDPHPGKPDVSCTQQYGHGPGSWTHTATVDGCRYTWNTPIPRELTGAQLREDVRGLRAAVYRLSRELEGAEGKLQALAEVRVWRNEDGRGFLFSDDVAAALGIKEQPSTTEAEHRADVVAERDAEIVAWLGKKAREYPSPPERQESVPDAITRLADKIQRGAVRAPHRTAEGGA